MRDTRYRCGECDQRLRWDGGRWQHRNGEGDHPAWPGRWCAELNVPTQTTPGR